MVHVGPLGKALVGQFPFFLTLHRMVSKSMRCAAKAVSQAAARVSAAASESAADDTSSAAKTSSPAAPVAADAPSSFVAPVVQTHLLRLQPLLLQERVILAHAPMSVSLR